MNLIIDFEVN